MMDWSQLTCSPDAVAIEVLRSSWSWLLPEPWTPVLFSVLGDVFLERPQLGVLWLNTGTGELTKVADNIGQFEAALATDAAIDWFMPPLVTRLRQAGKIPGPGRCYTYAILPIFAEGKYEIWNFNVVPASEHFGLTGELHAKLAAMPDGEKIRMIVDQP